MFSSIDELCRSVPEFSLLSVYSKPNIPRPKLVNAIKSYGKSFVKPDDILILVDDTVFGSAKEGFFLTKTHFFGNGISGAIDSNIGDVYTIDATINPRLCIEDIEDEDYDWEFTLPTGSKNDIYIFRDYLNECLATLVYLKEQTEKAEQIELERREKLEQEKQAQLAIRNAELERQQRINAIYQDTSDEVLARVNNLFKIISEIDGCFRSSQFSFRGFPIKK